MTDRLYTILIVPERSAKVRRIKVSQRRLVQLVFTAVAGLGLLTFMLVHYVYVLSQAAEYDRYRHENIALKLELKAVEEQMGRIDTTLAQIGQFVARVRTITQLNDPDRDLAMDPSMAQNADRPPTVLYAQGERIDYEDERLDSKLAMRLIEAGVDALDDSATALGDKVEKLHDALEDEEVRLAATPSLRPVHSKLLLSSFGARSDPYTEQQVMHKGIDFAADLGAEVVAPGDAVVIFLGNRGNGYGKTLVLDHGFGLQDPLRPSVRISGRNGAKSAPGSNHCPGGQQRPFDGQSLALPGALFGDPTRS